MYGFFGTIGSLPTTEYNLTELRSDAVIRKFDDGRLRLVHATLPKFINDKIFIETEDALYAIEGIILNSSELSQANGGASLETLIPKLYAARGDDFVADLRGSFAILVYDKKIGECRLYNDHTGDKLLFYHANAQRVRFAADMKILCSSVRAEGHRLTVSEEAVREMFSLGNFTDSKTLISKIRRVGAGECVIIDKDNRVTVKQYHHFHNIPNDNNFSQNIEETDRLFRQAVKRILDKNAEYGYSNVFPLSAGSDSRMTNWVARDLIDAAITNFSYSQSGCYEETVPGEIAKTLGNNFIFIPLDGGDYVHNAMEDAVRASCGLVYYTGNAQCINASRKIGIENAGCLATGHLGGELMKPHCNHLEGLRLRLCKILKINCRHDSSEIVFEYTKNFNRWLLNLSPGYQLFTETLAPYQDADFMQFIFTVPIAQRYNFKLYDKWILAKYPQAAKWKSNTNTIGKREPIVIFHREYFKLRLLPKILLFFILKRLRLMHRGDQDTIGQNMNPYDTWFDTNPKIRERYEQILARSIHHLDPFPDEKKFATDAIHNGRMTYKVRAITVLTALEMFLGED